MLGHVQPCSMYRNGIHFYATNMNSATSSMGSCNRSCAALERSAGGGRGSGLADAVAVFCGAENRALAFF